MRIVSNNSAHATRKRKFNILIGKNIRTHTITIEIGELLLKRIRTLHPLDDSSLTSKKGKGKGRGAADANSDSELSD